ncbi:hypothetical protein QUF74_01380 [Candidatus Halobeggiatoa sp. HSG11]|nr:hypothetical protein [Candidatus Halobeggiatoa sp. HSG11]
MNLKYIILIITTLFVSPLLADTDEIATAHIKKITGNVAESFMDRYYINNGWEKLRREVGVNGIDGLYVRRDKNGVIRKVLASESKAGSSQLGMTNCGKQMTHQWIICKLNESIKNNNKKLSSIPRYSEESLKLFRESKDTKIVLNYVEKDIYLRRLLQSKINDGILTVKITELHENNGEIYRKKIDGRHQVENKPLLKTTGEYKVNLKSSPASGYEKTLYKEYFTSIQTEFENKGVTHKDATKITKNLQNAYKNNVISNNVEEHRFLKQEYKNVESFKHIAEQAKLIKLIKNGKNLSKQSKLIIKQKLADLRYRVNQKNNFLPPKIRQAANAAAIATLFSATAHGWQVYQGEESLLEAAKAIGRDGGLAASSLIVSDAILQRVNGKLVITAHLPSQQAKLMGVKMGVATFVFDEAMQMYALAQGKINQQEFLTSTGESVVKSGLSGVASYGTVLLGATPGGLVMMGVGIGAYIVVNTTMEYIGQLNKAQYLTLADVLGHLPSGILNRVTLLEPESFSGLPTLLDAEPLSDRSTILEPETLQPNW